MKQDDFIDASVYLRYLEKQILSTNTIERLVDTSSMDEIMRLLTQNTRFDFSQLKAVEDHDVVLTADLTAAYELIRKLAGEKYGIIADIPAVKYDVHNMKVALKSVFNPDGTTPSFSDISQLNAAAIKAFSEAAAAADDADAYPDSVKQLLPEWAAAAMTDAARAYLKSRDPQDIDISLDKHQYGRMLELAKKTKSDFIVTYVQKTIDFYNTKTLFRIRDMKKGSYFLRRALAPGGLTETEYIAGFYDATSDTIAARLFYKHFGSTVSRGLEAYTRNRNYSELERIFDDELITDLKKSKLIAFGPETLFAYLLFKENEVRQIRIIIAGKLNNLSPEKLRERLRMNYA